MGLRIGLGTGMNTSDNSLAVLPNGDLNAGGFFHTAGGVSASGSARWNGIAKSTLGKGVDAWAFDLAALPNEHLFAAGSFFAACRNVSAYFARWTDTNTSIAVQATPRAFR